MWQGWKHAGKVHRGKSWYGLIVTWYIIQSVTMIIETGIWLIFQMQSPFTTISRRMIKINFYSMNIDGIWLGEACGYGWKPVKNNYTDQTTEIGDLGQKSEIRVKTLDYSEIKSTEIHISWIWG